jgi:tetratricopeptide (TPR) repeat protein
LRLQAHPLASLRVGRLRQQAGDLDGAEQALKLATQWQPSLVPAWLQLAQLALVREQPQAAMAAWEQAARWPSPQRPMIHLELASRWLAAGFLDRAREHAAAALALGQPLPAELRAALAQRNLVLPADP